MDAADIEREAEIRRRDYADGLTRRSNEDLARALRIEIDAFQQKYHRGELNSACINVQATILPMITEIQRRCK